jgi:hypothetical protein
VNVVDVLGERLEPYPAEVRRDFATVVQVALRECPRRWSRRRGVQDLWVALRDGEVSVRRPARQSIAGYRYGDDVHTERFFKVDLDREIGDNRCLALLYGNGWRSIRLPFMSSADDAVVVNAKHSGGDLFAVEIPFTRRPLRGIRFDSGVHRLVEAILAA